MVKDHSDSERGNPLPPYGLLFSISSKCSFNIYMDHPTDRIIHTTAFVTPVVGHWLEWEIAQWVHHEGSIRWSIAPWANALTTELHLAPCLHEVQRVFRDVPLRSNIGYTEPRANWMADSSLSHTTENTIPAAKKQNPFLLTHSEREREMFYLTTHSTHFIYGYMASDTRLRTILIVRKETRCRHIGYSLRLTARVLLYAPSHRQDNTYHGLCYTSRGALAGTRNSSMGPPHEGSIRRPIAPWANALPLSYVPLLTHSIHF